MIRRTLLLVAAAALMSLAVPATAGIALTQHGAISRSTAAGHVTRTSTSWVSPVTHTGRIKAGYSIVARYGHATCEPGSDTGINAYRCGVKNGVIDPCWIQTGPAKGHHVLCLTKPWSRKVIQLTWKPAGNEALTPGSVKALLGVRMADGKLCVDAQGAHDTFAGKTVNFFCTKDTELIGYPTVHRRVWTIREATHDANFKDTKLGKVVAVAHGWYGRASISFGKKRQG
jgi:hypothetical protein